MGNQAGILSQPASNGAVVSGPSAAHRLGGGTEGCVGLRGKSFMDFTLTKGCASLPT